MRGGTQNIVRIQEFNLQVKVRAFNNTRRMEELIGIAFDVVITYNTDRLRAVARARGILVPTPVKP